MAIPDWQLPPGVDRGLWDYFHADDMIRGYDAQMAASPLATADVAFCESAFPTPGKLIDLGCGTGRLCLHFARKAYNCTGVDLSHEMLAVARANAAGMTINYQVANLVDLIDLPDATFDYAACLFSTLGMIRGPVHRLAAVRAAARVLKPGGTFVVHVHHRYFHRLGWKGLWTGDLTMPQAYGGAPLTLHHFTRGEAVRLLETAGFRVEEVRAVSEMGESARSWRGTYGYLMRARK